MRMLRIRRVAGILRRLRNGGRVDVVLPLGIPRVDVGGWNAVLLLYCGCKGV